MLSNFIDDDPTITLPRRNIFVLATTPSTCVVVLVVVAVAAAAADDDDDDDDDDGELKMFHMYFANILKAIGFIFFYTEMSTALNSIEPPSKAALVVVFGRPGSGKTTIAQATLADLEKRRARDNRKRSVRCFGLDLDVCVPQWMKDNFSDGIYPTLEQRKEFAVKCCEYVEHKCRKVEEQHQATADGESLAALISFSFVNTDIRDIFRAQFPRAVWVLVNTNEEVASVRISQRDGHFYRGKPSHADDEAAVPMDKTDDNDRDEDNSEWNFAPVTFDHIVLNGNEPVETNSRLVSYIVRETATLTKNRQ